METLKKVKVINMISPRGNKEVVNQFEITIFGEATYFQSYNSIIVCIPREGKTILDEKYWNYSTTTGKYRNQFLGEDITETKKKIKNGEYILANLN